MKRSKFSVLTFLVFVITFMLSIPVYATLIDNGDETVTQIRNDTSKLMWLKDASFAATSGYCLTGGNCLDSNGMVTWDQANNWIAYLNNTNYAGYSDWRLPETLPVNGISYNWNWSYDGSTDRGWNIASPNSEMAYLFYVELGNLGEYDTNGNYQSGFAAGNSSGPFINIVNLNNPAAAFNDGWYWSGTDIVGGVDGYDKVGFNFGLGRQYGGYIPGYGDHVWAVRDCSSCPVTAVPEPATSTLFVIGGTVILAGRRYLKRRAKLHVTRKEGCRV